MNLKIGIIIGSTRPTRAGKTITDWFYSQVKDTPDVKFDIIDLKTENLPFLSEPQSAVTGVYEQEKSRAWSKKIANYDGFVFVTSEYNHGYPAPLKNAIDTLFHEWSKKPVAFVGYGGLGGSRAIEQLIPVIARTGAVPLAAPTLNITNVWSAIDDAGNVKPENIMGDHEKLVENLIWWAKTLKPSRESVK
jgi:NAD(P)H-dependent FMN reductase